MNSVTLYNLAEKYIGIRELAGDKDHPLIQWWLSRCFDGKLDLHDEVSWCSAALDCWAWELGLPHPGSAMARSWLKVGTAIPLSEAKTGFDVIVLWRGERNGPFGHVGLYSGLEADGQVVHLLGGNQGNAVSVAGFPVRRVLGVRRLQV